MLIYKFSASYHTCSGLNINSYLLSTRISQAQPALHCATNREAEQASRKIPPPPSSRLPGAVAPNQVCAGKDRIRLPKCRSGFLLRHLSSSVIGNSKPITNIAFHEIPA